MTVNSGQAKLFARLLHVRGGGGSRGGKGEYSDVRFFGTRLGLNLIIVARGVDHGAKNPLRGKNEASRNGKDREQEM